MPDTSKLVTVPVGRLGIIPMASCKEMGERVDQYLVKWRKERSTPGNADIHFNGYERDSYIIHSTERDELTGLFQREYFFQYAELFERHHPGEEMDGNVIIDRAITRIREVNLNADQNTVSFTFSGLNYFRPVQTYYRVRVPGLFDEWRNYSYYDGTGLVDSKGMFHLPLVGLKPGDYEIYVQASMYPDMWPSDDDRFWWTVHVNQPWWQSVGVYVILGLLVLMMLALNFYVYTKNMRMRAQVNGEEGEIIRKIRSFVDRCETFMTTSFAPSIDDSFERVSINALSPEFISIMTKVMPFVLQHKTSDFTMRQLSQVSGVEVSKLYDVLTAHLYKSPHSLARHLLLERGAKLLRETDMTIEQIAQDCTFYTPNYFIGNFFHQFLKHLICWFLGGGESVLSVFRCHNKYSLFSATKLRISENKSK